jgi:hypothetical protein
VSTDRQLADKLVRTVGYQTTVGPVDRSKVNAAADGVRKAQPSAGIAQVAWELYLRDAHNPVPVVKLPAPFDGNGLVLLEPTGGTEDIGAAKAAGFTYLLLNLGYASGGSWDTQRSRARNLGLAVVPWRRVLTPADSRHVEQTADAWGSPAAAHNLENPQVTTTYKPAALAGVCGEFRPRPRAVLTEPWMQNGAGWSALKTWVAMPETFQNANAAYTPTALTQHAHQEGMPLAVPLFGWGEWSDAPNYVKPSTYLAEWPGPFAVYMGDGKESQYGEWRR